LNETAGEPVRTRVRYPETDRMGVACHGHYLAWFELGRTELMRGIGMTYLDLEERRGVHFPVVEVHARYREPARYDDRVEVSTRVAEIRGARVRFEYALIRVADGRQLASGYSVHAAVDRAGRPMRLPADLKRQLEGRSA
jgi:acyl-CoA thioester hydrolase